MNVFPIRRPPELRGEPIRWHRKFGRPRCLIEAVLQHTWLVVPYIALVVTLILIIDYFGIHK